MKLKRFFIGVSIGVVVGLTFQNLLRRDILSPEKALKKVIYTLKEKGLVEGSWVHMIPENYKHNSNQLTIYRGGVSCMIEGEVYQYDFIVNALTGEILELEETNL